MKSLSGAVPSSLPEMCQTFSPTDLVYDKLRKVASDILHAVIVTNRPPFLPYAAALVAAVFFVATLAKAWKPLTFARVTERLPAGLRARCFVV